jgi:hypothetical protein
LVFLINLTEKLVAGMILYPKKFYKITILFRSSKETRRWGIVAKIKIFIRNSCRCPFFLGRYGGDPLSPPEGEALQGEHSLDHPQ